MNMEKIYKPYTERPNPGLKSNPGGDSANQTAVLYRFFKVNM